MKKLKSQHTIKIEMTMYEAMILEMILSYNKPRYFDELNNVPKNAPHAVHPDVIKKVYNDTLETLK